jgi:NTE family protein
MRSLLGALATLVLVQGCATTRFENTPLEAGRANVERRAVDVSHPDQPLILVAFSGGGSRAAALGWVVLRELQTYRYTSSDGTSRSLVDDISVISSVSGGSVIGAQFALYGAAGLDRFEPDFLALDNTRTLGTKALDPLSWVASAFTGTSRSDLVEQLLERQLFGQKTFADLNLPGRPYLILNATDMASGQVFAFTPKRFDDICSDLDAQSIASGVAASAAVPVAFTAIALRNYSAERCADVPVPRWVVKRLEDDYSPYLNVDAYKLARYANDLRQRPDRFRQIDYVYLLDGGLADNLAVHGLLEVLSSPYAATIVAPPAVPGAQGAPGTVLQAINSGRVRKVAVIVVNARADPANKISQTESRPGILGMIGAVTSLPIDSASSSINAQIDSLLSQFNAAGGGAPPGTIGDPKFAGLKVYGIEIDFDQLRPNDPAQRALRDQAKEIPTLWTITRPNLDVIERAGTILLHQHPCFQRLLSDLAIHAEFVDVTFARTGCAQAGDP